MTDCLQAEHAVIVRAGHDADKSRFVLLAESTAVGEKRKGADYDLVTRGFRLSRQQTDANYFWVGEADRRHRHLIKHPLPSRHQLCHHFSLCHRAMRKHRLSGEVTDRPYVSHRRRATTIDTHKRPVHIEIQAIEPETFGSRTAADRRQNLICG